MCQKYEDFLTLSQECQNKEPGVRQNKKMMFLSKPSTGRKLKTETLMRYVNPMVIEEDEFENANVSK